MRKPHTGFDPASFPTFKATTYLQNIYVCVFFSRFFFFFVGLFICFREKKNKWLKKKKQNKTKHVRYKLAKEYDQKNIYIYIIYISFFFVLDKTWGKTYYVCISDEVSDEKYISCTNSIWFLDSLVFPVASFDQIYLLFVHFTLFFFLPSSFHWTLVQKDKIIILFR